MASEREELRSEQDEYCTAGVQSCETMEWTLAVVLELLKGAQTA